MLFIKRVKESLIQNLDKSLDLVSPYLLKRNQTRLASFLWKLRFSLTSEVWSVAPLLIKNLSKVGQSEEVDFYFREERQVPVYSNIGEIVEWARFYLWVACIKDSFVYHGTSFIVNSDRKLAYADILDETNRNYDYSLNAVKYTYLQRGLLILNEQNKVVIEKGVLLAGRGSFNYFHLLIEIFTRFYCLHKSGAFHQYPLLVDDVVLNVKQYKEALDLLNIHKQEIIPLKRHTTYQVRELIVPSDGARIPFNEFDFKLFVPKDIQINPEAIQYLRGHFLKHLQKEQADAAAPPRRIFIGRRSTLRTYNEDELWPIAARYGFEKIYPEELTFSEQVNMFSRCEYVLACSGAALTNIMFMKENASILYWLSEEHTHFNTFITLAKVVKCSISFIAGKEVDNNSRLYHSAFNVEPANFEKALQSLLAEREAGGVNKPWTGNDKKEELLSN